MVLASTLEFPAATVTWKPELMAYEVDRYKSMVEVRLELTDSVDGIVHRLAGTTTQTQGEDGWATRRSSAARGPVDSSNHVRVLYGIIFQVNTRRSRISRSTPTLPEPLSLRTLIAITLARGATP